MTHRVSAAIQRFPNVRLKARIHYKALVLRTTVGLNIPLLRGQIGLDFTVGQSLVSDENSVS